MATTRASQASRSYATGVPRNDPSDQISVTRLSTSVRGIDKAPRQRLNTSRNGIDEAPDSQLSTSACGIEEAPVKFNSLKFQRPITRWLNNLDSELSAAYQLWDNSETEIFSPAVTVMKKSALAIELSNYIKTAKGLTSKIDNGINEWKQKVANSVAKEKRLVEYGKITEYC
ncbi:unnamed protein product [Bursaphelenchus okinawaensis]|uniref:Uncharacterized protein n=1 Tax=Bursaphelenchus okinawaensis TaxID=465554 RepID=A0A811LR80_9BILA|nr:unnamed protein product [Bursaphelenchus okinawaensis]CAG9128042.1 unnamed protein product [Bursaphelenchus okinawaensis]